MNHRQRKYLESIGVLIATLVAVSVLFEEHRRMAAVSLVPALFYIAFNWEALQSFPAVGPSPKEVLEHSSLVRGAVVGLLVIEIVIGYSFVITGGNITEYVSGFGSLYLVLVAPVLPPIIVSQVLLFRRLGNGNP